MSGLPTDKRSINHDRQVVRILFGGMLGLVVAMGIGRFAFTPILPLMQRDLAMSNTLAGWLAGLNYLGYLLGAILCSVSPKILRYKLVTGGSLLLSLATTIFMGATLSEHWWAVMRFAGGFASAILFIVISAEVGEALARRGYGHWTGALYGGVGAGVAISGLAVPQLDRMGGWSTSWYGMGIIAVLLAVSGIALGRKRDLVQEVTCRDKINPGHLGPVKLLAVAYFFEGLGYIVTATFIVAIISTTPGLESFAPYSWVAVGLAAVPSTLFWPYLVRRIGSRYALLAAYLLQASGILVSIRADSILEVIFVAISFGGTFMGIVAMTLGEGSQRMPGASGRAAAFLTASFGVGQVLGPVFAGVLADLQQGFTLPLLLAAGSVLSGCVFIVIDRGYQTAKV